MAEPFGIAAGAVGIASVFTTCVDCFNYIQIGRELDRDFQQHVVTLKLLEMRLSRWGAAVNIYDDPTLGNPDATPDNIYTAKMTLFQILGLFAESERKSKPFHSSAPWDPAMKFQDPAMAALATTASSVASDRKRGVGLLKRARWALHDRGSLKELTGGISELMGSLENLFPATQAQQRLADEDIEKIAQSVKPEDLRNLAEGVDKLLQERTSDTGHIYKFITAKDSVQMSNGTVIFGNKTNNEGKAGVGSHGRSHIYHYISAEGSTKMHNGDMFDRSVFDQVTRASP